MYQGASLIARLVNHQPAMQETRVQFLDQEDPVEKEMVTPSSTFAWRIPWTEEPGRLQSTGSQRVRHNWATSISLFTITSYCIIHNISLVVKWLCGLKNHGLVTQLLGHFSSVQFSSVQTLSRVQLFATPWIAARQASLSITNFQSSFRPTSIESVMPSSHLILCRPLLLLPPVPPSIRVFSNESTRRMRWPKYWSFSLASFLPKKFQGWSPSEWTGWISLQSKGLSRVFCNTTVQKHQFFGAQPSSQSNSHIHTRPQEKP